MSRIAYISLGLILFCLTKGAAANDRPAGYVKICGSAESCTLDTTANVAFGLNNQFSYRVLSGTFVCSPATFGSNVQMDAPSVCSIPSRLLRIPAQRSGTGNYVGDSQKLTSDSST